MRGKYGNRVRRSFGAKPSRSWSSINGDFLFSAISATTATPLIRLEMPNSLNNITSDPPEDLTVLRVRGSFLLFLSGSNAAVWTLAMTVQDVTWTPGATFNVDADKRILWSRTFAATNVTSDQWSPPNLYTNAGGTALPHGPGVCDLDISPKVKIEPGKGLYLVAYENAGTGTLTLVTHEMRVLFQRTARRR